MKIHEAIKATTIRKPYVTREAWAFLTVTPETPVKLLPTNSPDGCILISTMQKDSCRWWQPTAGDLLADDWGITA